MAHSFFFLPLKKSGVRSTSVVFLTGMKGIRGSAIGAAEVEDVAVGVLDFKAAEVVGVVVDGTEEGDVAGGKFGGEGVRVGCVNVSIPREMPFFDIARVVGDGFDTDGLEHNHGATALDDAEEDVTGFGPLKSDLEAELILIEGEGRRDIFDDERWRDSIYRRFRFHVSNYGRSKFGCRAEQAPHQYACDPPII